MHRSLTPYRIAMNSSPPSRISVPAVDRALWSRREPVQQLVAAIMAVRVVDLLEVVRSM